MTVGLVEEFPSAEQIQSPACTAVIILHLIMMYICTGTIETLHATVRRFILGISTQTHQRMFTDVQCSWLAAGFRRFTESAGQKLGVRALKLAGGEEAQSKARKKRKVMSETHGQSEQVKQRRAGGPWRAFLRDRLWKCGVKRPFKRSMGELADAYANLSGAERATYKRVGKHATKAGRSKAAPTHSAFGPRGRDVDRRKANEYHKSLRHLVGSVDDERGYLASIRDVGLTSGSVTEAIAVANQDVRVRNSVAYGELVADARELTTYSDRHNAVVERQYKECFPASDHSVIAVPSETGVVVSASLFHDKDVDDLSNLLGHASLHAGAEATLNSTLDSAWQSLNSCIMESECEPCSTAKPPPSSVGRQAFACARRQACSYVACVTRSTP